MTMADQVRAALSQEEALSNRHPQMREHLAFTRRMVQAGALRQQEYTEVPQTEGGAGQLKAMAIGKIQTK